MEYSHIVVCEGITDILLTQHMRPQNPMYRTYVDDNVLSKVNPNAKVFLYPISILGEVAYIRCRTWKL